MRDIMEKAIKQIPNDMPKTQVANIIALLENAGYKIIDSEEVKRIAALEEDLDRLVCQTMFEIPSTH